MTYENEEVLIIGGDSNTMINHCMSKKYFSLTLDGTQQGHPLGEGGFGGVSTLTKSGGGVFFLFRRIRPGMYL